MITLNTECYSSNDVKRVFKIECFQKDKETFEKTHYSLSFVFKHPQGREISMMEDALAEDQWKIGLKDRQSIGDYIRPYVIWGAPGTGKTELCRWLELNIPRFNQDNETKRITKRELAMGGILGVAQSLSKSQIDFADRLLSRHGNVGIEDLAVFAIGNLIKQGKISVKAGNLEELLEMLKVIIRKNIEKRVKLIDNAEDISKVETTLEFITVRDLQGLEYYGIEMDIGKVNRELYRALTPFVAHVDDVKKLIFNFIKEKNESGKIPVLIFDDVTHLGDLVDDFVSVITDISGGDEHYVCDFIIGTTSDFYFSKFQDSLASTARARTFEIKLSPEERQDMTHANWLLGEKGLSHFLDFVLRYLDVARNCNECDQCAKELFIESSNNYYPFTKTFLINLYNRLLREKEEPPRKGITVSLTPRFIIQVIRHALLRFIETSKPPSSFMDESLILDTTDFFSLSQEEKERFRDLLLATWWYGEHKENKVSIYVNLLNQLGLSDRIPANMRGRSTIEFSIIPLKSTPTTSITALGGRVIPQSPDDVSLKTHIRAWCRGEDSRVAINSIVEGFNEIVRNMRGNSDLFGSNSFKNIMNFKSSREGETIEFTPPGRKECYFWVGELRGEDNLQIYLMSRYKEASLEPFREKFIILTLNEDDFFNLYKIGSPKTSRDNMTTYLLGFFNSKRDEIYEALWSQRLKLKEYLETQLGGPVECFVLSVYLLANKILKSTSALMDIHDVSNLKKFLLSTPDLTAEDWSDICDSVQSLINFFDTLKDLFFSFFSLRGEGSIIDYPLLEKAWLEIREDPFQILRQAAQHEIDKRFNLSKSRWSLQQLVKLMNGLLDKIDSYVSKTFKTEKIKEKVREVKELVSQIEDKDTLIGRLESLEAKIKDYYQVEFYELNSIISELERVENSRSVLEKLELIETRCANLEDFVDKASLLATLNKVERSGLVRAARRLNEVLHEIESKTYGDLESELKRLKDQYLNFLKVGKVL